MSNKSIIIIPSRLESTRLPNKPLLKINNTPMIIEVVKRAQEADIADIVVAAGNKEIAECVEDFGVKAVLTENTLKSGSDRVYSAIEQIDPNANYKYIVNLQGDLPTIDASYISKCLSLLQTGKYDITTLASVINIEDEKTNPNVVKAVLSMKSEKEGKALYFTRAQAPYGKDALLYHHIGIYSYTRDSLSQFISYKPTYLEQTESLEQLRALENDMSIGVSLVSGVPIGVDTEQDLQEATKVLRKKN